MKNNIVVCTDCNYSKYISVLFESIIVNSNVNINFFVIYSSINENDKFNIEKIIKQRAENSVNFIKFNFQEELAKIDYKTELPSFRGGYDAYTRLFLPQLLKKYNADSCLYLDADIVVNKNLDKIFELLNNTKVISGVLDTIAIKNNHSLSHDKYINSGVLLMNLKVLKDLNFTIKSLDFAKDRVNELKYPDQDIINNIFPKDSNYITHIDDSYNMYYSSSSLAKKGIILHYIGCYKPWLQKANCRWRYKKCMWVKYRIATDLFLKGKKISPTTISAIGHMLAMFRSFLNLYLQIKIVLGIVKK